jgi:NADH-quinone oxidoreductase subunit J
MLQRMRDYADRGVHPGPLPNPGAFARHNSVDTPALLPDGNPSELSISRVMRARGTVRDVSAETALVRRAETKADPELEGGEAK